MDTAKLGERAITAPTKNGTPPLPKRTPKGLLPSTWYARELKVEHAVGGAVRSTVGTLADTFPVGMVLNVAGARTMISWDTVAVITLCPD